MPDSLGPAGVVLRIAVAPIGGDLLIALASLQRRGQPPDERACEELEAKLFAGFHASPEGVTRTKASWPKVIADLAARHLGRVLASVNAPALEELVFFVLPRVATLEPAPAAAVIAELRGFFAYLGRAHSFALTDELLDALDDDAAARLADAIAEAGQLRFVMA